MPYICRGIHLFLVIVKLVFFLCKYGLTDVIRGVDTRKRKAVFHYQCGSRRVTEGCKEECVPLDVGSQH